MGTKRTLWFFDFDGTLSRIVEDRHAAVLDPECRRMLEELVRNEGNVVAVLSSRRIDDVAARVDVPGVLIGGSSGAVWRSGDQVLISPSKTMLEELERMRGVFLPLVKKATERFPGVEIEDKEWSLGVHVRQVPPRQRCAVLSSLSSLSRPFETALYQGPESMEFLFLAQVNKAYGVRTLCERLGVTEPERLFYAGDDENDLVAMALVRHLGGEVVSVGMKPLWPNGRLIRGPGELPGYVASCACAWDAEQAKPWIEAREPGPAPSTEIAGRTN
jgi:trehalose 6-phosphate phosphatase